MAITEFEHVIVALETAFREGTNEDVPEGARYIKLSDTIARQMVNALRQYERNQERRIEELLA